MNIILKLAAISDIQALEKKIHSKWRTFERDYWFSGRILIWTTQGKWDNLENGNHWTTWSFSWELGTAFHNLPQSFDQECQLSFLPRLITSDNNGILHVNRKRKWQCLSQIEKNVSTTESGKIWLHSESTNIYVQ